MTFFQSTLSHYDPEREQALIQQKTERMIATHPWMHPEAMAIKTSAIVAMNASAKVKRQHLIVLADAVNAAVAPFAACKAGCSQCCSMPTLIYQHEADRLGAASGRVAKKLNFRPRDEVVTSTAKLYGQPCPFLENRQCSVYDARPIICRLHHSLNETADQCDCSIPQASRQPIGQYNPDFVEVPYHLLVQKSSPTEAWGAIQEFFPGVA